MCKPQRMDEQLLTREQIRITRSYSTLNIFMSKYKSLRVGLNATYYSIKSSIL